MDRRTYRSCDNYPDTNLTPAHIFDSPAVHAALQEIRVLFSSTNLYEDNILNRYPEQSFGPMVLSYLISSWTRHDQHRQWATFKTVT
ncbi:hypothetical protein TNCV_4257621 [Trichonephila clavipes]|nr:hypothetical protein TNCV_4257621 [Trichonephila clavipes]